MAKQKVRLQYVAAFATNYTETLPPGQQYWWLRKDSEFVRLPKRVRADEPLDMYVQLEPGRYVLGVGPVHDRVRKDIVVAGVADDESESEDESPPLAKGTQETKSPGASIDVKGKSVVLTGDLDGLDRDAAKAWLVSLGAKVTSAVSGNTQYVIAGREPGPKKLEKAAELGIPVISAADVHGGASAAAPAAKPKDKPAPTSKLKKLIETLCVPSDQTKLEKHIGVSKFADLGMVDNELWGIAIGPRGGHYNVHVNFKDRPNYAVKCSCRDRNPCKHGLALLLTADQNFVPPVPAPEGHEEASRYVPGWE